MTPAEREEQWRRHAEELRASGDEDLLARIVAGGIGQFRLADAAAAELQRRTTVRLIESVDRFSQESRRQSRWMFWLTVIIAVLTGVLLLQGFGYSPAVGSPSLTPEGSGERASDVDGVWDEHAAGRRAPGAAPRSR